jgi:hypothetical protein
MSVSVLILLFVQLSLECYYWWLLSLIWLNSFVFEIWQDVFSPVYLRLFLILNKFVHIFVIFFILLFLLNNNNYYLECKILFIQDCCCSKYNTSIVKSNKLLNFFGVYMMKINQFKRFFPKQNRCHFVFDMWSNIMLLLSFDLPKYQISFCPHFIRLSYLLSVLFSVWSLLSVHFCLFFYFLKLFLILWFYNISSYNRNKVTQSFQTILEILIHLYVFS